MGLATIGIIAILIILVGFIAVLIWMWKRLHQIKTGVPPEILKDFELAERMVKENQQNGITETGEQILFRIGKARVAEQGRTNAVNPTTETGISKILPERREPVQDRVIDTDSSDESVPIASYSDSSDSPRDERKFISKLGDRLRAIRNRGNKTN